MFLFMILLLTILILSIFVVATIALFGAGFIIIFGDVIVCILILTWLIKKIFFNKKKKDKR